MWTPPFRETDPTLPDIGTGILTVKRISPDAADAVFASTNVVALALMRGYAATYAGPSGGLIFATAGALAWWAAGFEWFAAASFGIAGTLGYILLEIRRRARKWVSIVDARLAQLGAG